MTDDERREVIRRDVIRQWERMAERSARPKILSKEELSAIREAHARMALAATPRARKATEKRLYALLTNFIPASYYGDDDA